MARYRDALPQLADTVFLTDTGIETTLIFHDGFDLPYFAAVTLLRDEAGRRRLDRYFLEHAQVAAEAGTGFILESATWRASPDWGDLLGYSRSRAGRREPPRGREPRRSSAAELDSEIDVVVSGCIGPRGDGYDGTALMAAKQARDYHAEQVQTFAAHRRRHGARHDDDLSGRGRRRRPAPRRRRSIPVAISFTVETDGVLPDGTGLRRGHRARRRRHRRSGRVLRDQLRPPDPLRARARCRRGLDAAAARPAGQRLAQVPRRAGRVRDAGRRRSRSSSARSTRNCAAAPRT